MRGLVYRKFFADRKENGQLGGGHACAALNKVEAQGWVTF